MLKGNHDATCNLMLCRASVTDREIELVIYVRQLVFFLSLSLSHEPELNRNEISVGVNVRAQ